MTVHTAYQHILLDDHGVAWIEDANMKVVELVLDHLAYGWSPEELCLQHPALSLGQIHSALAYYWDHQDALDSEIERRLARVDELAQGRKLSALEIRLHSHRKTV